MLDVILLGVAALIGLGITGALWPRLPQANVIVYGGSLIVSAVLAGAGLLDQLRPSSGAVAALSLPMGLPWVEVHFRVDLLSGFFAVLLNFAGALISLFALGYGRHDAEPRRVLPFYPAYLGMMNLVLVADDAFAFLLSWETMSIVSWLLVLANHRQEGNARAAFIYLLMASFGTLALLFAFGLLAGAEGGYSFAAMRAGTPDAWAAGFVVILALIGAGSKAGLVPLHVWLPLAHPAAPSHVSALMSGVMTKIAIYGFIRIVFDLVGAPQQWWWGGMIMCVGAISAVLGILYALMERDLKTLLAYSTVENVGIIMIGLGLSLAFRASGVPEYAALPFVAALFHALNHALFKSLLFCSAALS